MSAVMTFDKAVEALDEHLRLKTVHSVKSLREYMLVLCNDTKWLNVEDHIDFSNICSNFDKYAMVKNMTSFGRKQFEAAWEKNFEVEDSLNNAVTMLKNKDVLNEDPLPDVFGSDDPVVKPAEGFTDVKYANIYIEALEAENENLKLEVVELRKAMKEIRRMLNPWD